MESSRENPPKSRLNKKDKPVNGRPDKAGKETIKKRCTDVFCFIRDLGIALLSVFVFTSVILLVAKASPLEAYYHIFKGSLGSLSKFSHVINVWIPLTLCACGLLFTFKIGLWNIGVEGQVMMGAVFTTAALRWGLQAEASSLVLLVSFFAGAVGGALWALLAGYLKTRSGVHEIFAGLGLNFVAQGIVLWLIFGPWKQPGVASMSGTELFPQKLWLYYTKAFRLSPTALGLVLLALVLTAILLRYARIGLNLKAVGSNATAAFLFGLKPDRCMLVAMLFAGGLAGLAGNLQVTGVYHRLLPAISSNYGYLALLVVMLSNYNIRAVPAVAFFFACLNTGSIQLPIVLQLDSSLSGAIQGLLVLAALGLQAWVEEAGHQKESVHD